LGSRLYFTTGVTFVPYDFQPDIESEQRRKERLLTIDARNSFNSEDITNGVPQLIKNGKIDITWEQEKSSKSFVETRHPRTAVAKLKDGKFLMITVDGRSESSGGIGLHDLAALLLEFGAVEAMNLDGGGSTTMFLDGKVVNHPSDKEGERKVSDAILVSLRKKVVLKKK
jgi:exopolysaccharide biosynthesis protein